MTRKPAPKLTAAALLIAGLVISRMAADGELEHDAGAVPSPAPSPGFSIRWHDGQLELSGHTLSERHEQDLLQLATSTFPNAVVKSTFEPLGVVPEYWDRLTLQTVYLLSETISATARLSAHTINIRGVSPRSLGWQSRLAAVENQLPEEVTLSAKTLAVNTSVDVDRLCRRAFKYFDAGPINFEESTANFRSSAFPRLQRVVSLAKICPEAALTITGHTDASGSDDWNQQLSLKRARAVGAYLAQAGVKQERLRIAGKGSTEPVADNATRYGRGKNRRIEIELRL